jgi:hypothetical protein
MGWLSNLLRTPFSFFGTRSTREERLTAYIVREHQRGRTLAEILDDPYIRNRATPQERNRLLDRPEVIRAIGEDIVNAVRTDMSSQS